MRYSFQSSESPEASETYWSPISDMDLLGPSLERQEAADQVKRLWTDMRYQ